MLSHRRRVVGIGGVILSLAFPGCSGEVESPPAESGQIEINPAMEKMQEEMMAKYGKKTGPRRGGGAAKGKD